MNELAYSEDTIQPDYSVGGTISFGPSGTSGTVSAGVGTAPNPGCVNCGKTATLNQLSLPIVLLVLAGLILALRS